MKPESFLDDRVTLWAGDCLDVLARLEENSVDSCVCDPPYHLTSIVKRFSKAAEADNTVTSKRVRERADGYARLVAGGFMGKAWDGGDIAFQQTTWEAVYRVLKPGAHLIAFSGTRTYHRMACAIEDAGFEIRDSLAWMYGTGFPKSHALDKGIDQHLGTPGSKGAVSGSSGSVRNSMAGDFTGGEYHAYVPATDAAREWQGWGTALKPAFEPIVLARKPLSEKTVAANVLRWGTGALNIDGCRIDHGGSEDTRRNARGGDNGLIGTSTFRIRERRAEDQDLRAGRWPANVCHDGSDEVVEAFPDVTSHGGGTSSTGFWQRDDRRQPIAAGDSGSAARFFYSAKADSDDRLGSKHPTVKPLDLMQYLVRLVTPKGGIVLDPFAGTGTTGEAAFREGMRAILIEREAEYCEDIRRRMRLVLAGPDERGRETIKAKMKDRPVDAGPLFADGYNGQRDFAGSLDAGYQAIRERVAAGGKSWSPK